MLSQLSLDLLLSSDQPDADTPCTPAEAFGLAAEVVSGKWTTPIIRELLTGTKRYSQLQSALAGVSPKMLTARLRLLEDKELITRKVYATVPPKTEYRLTELGQRLKPVIVAMEHFGSELAEGRSA